MTGRVILDYSSRVRPYPGHHVSGDAVMIRELEGVLFVAIVDVLGHGPEAHELTKVIDAYLRRYGSTDVAGLMKRLHDYLNGTRGAAMGLCTIDARSGSLQYVGVGNTVIRRFGKSETRLVSKDGVLGHNMRSLLPQALQLEPGDLVVLYTDGVSDRFTAEDYPSVLHHSAEEVARNIVQRFGKGHDDAACIAVRFNE
ncbi:MAG: PP2C family protein-serine/threonine phosphatase [Gammaproteobacteria bacterium]